MAKEEQEELEAKREVEDTSAKRESLADLQHKLSQKRCAYCGVCAWRVERTDGCVRYVRCKGCGRSETVHAKASS